MVKLVLLVELVILVWLVLLFIGTLPFKLL